MSELLWITSGEITQDIVGERNNQGYLSHSLAKICVSKLPFYIPLNHVWSSMSCDLSGHSCALYTSPTFSFFSFPLRFSDSVLLSMILLLNPVRGIIAATFRALFPFQFNLCCRTVDVHQKLILFIDGPHVRQSQRYCIDMCTGRKKILCAIGTSIGQLLC